jgi:hypothetical protein
MKDAVVTMEFTGYVGHVYVPWIGAEYREVLYP